MKNILNRVREDFYRGTGSDANMEYREIFVNPTKRELRSIEKETGLEQVRFIADKEEKNVYVSAIDVFHINIATKIGKGTEDYYLDNFSGMGEIWEGKVEVMGLSDNFRDNIEKRTELYKDVYYGEYNWMRDYNFDISEIEWAAERELNKMHII